MDSRTLLDTGLDLSQEAFSDKERDDLVAWYAEHHDIEGYDLSAFARFQLHHDQLGFKRGRGFIFGIDSIPGPELPAPVAVLLFVHTYTAIGFAKGVLYETVALRNLGARPSEVRAAIRLGGLLGGPRGLNDLGALMTNYLVDWDDEDAPGLSWPTSWSTAATDLRTPLDPSTTALSDDEIVQLREWYQRVEGNVPAHVDRLLELGAGPAVKAALLRWDGALDDALPAAMVPLMRAHRAIVARDEAAARRSVAMATTIGVDPVLVLRAMLWGAYYGAEDALPLVADCAPDLRTD